MKSKTMEAVLNVKNALDELKKLWVCPLAEGLYPHDCDNCKYYTICGLDFDIRRNLNTIYMEFAEIEGKL